MRTNRHVDGLREELADDDENLADCVVLAVAIHIGDERIDPRQPERGRRAHHVAVERLHQRAAALVVVRQQPQQLGHRRPRANL